MPPPGPLIFGPPTVSEVGSIPHLGVASPPPAAPALSVTDTGGVVLVSVNEAEGL